MTTNPKVVVIGLDGASWDFILPWVKKGELPTFKNLIENGVWGELESTIPPWTVPAWNSLLTGIDPGKLDFATFMVKRGYKFKPYFLEKDINDRRNLWDILSISGKNICVANIPSIHHAYEINGCMIAGFLYLDEKRITYPKNLKKEIDYLCNDYEVDSVIINEKKGRLDFPETKKEFLRKIYEILKKRFTVFSYLIKEKSWDFCCLVFTETDRIQHTFWENEKEVLKIYRMLDTYLNELLKQLEDDNVHIFFVSDHGFGPVKRMFNINEWLLQKGYLVLNKSSSAGLSYKLTRNILKLKILPFSELIMKILPGKIRKNLINMTKALSYENLDINWEKTKAFAWGVFGDIWLNLKGREPTGSIDPSDYNEIIEELQRELKNLIDPKTGKKLRTLVFKKEELYHSPSNNLPDLSILVNEDINAIWSYIGSGQIFSEGNGGNHRLNGLLLAYGPDIRKSRELKNAKIYDIFPTILHIFGLPIPDDVDGKVLMELFESNSEIAKRKPLYTDLDFYKNKQEKIELKKKIKALKRGKLHNII